MEWTGGRVGIKAICRVCLDFTSIDVCRGCSGVDFMWRPRRTLPIRYTAPLIPHPHPRSATYSFAWVVLATWSYILGFIETRLGVLDLKGVENRSSPLLRLVAFTTAWTSVQAVIY